MIICINCKKEMTCTKNGVAVRYGIYKDHVYAGDKFKCRNCGHEIIRCNDRPHHEDNPKILEDDICMNN